MNASTSFGYTALHAAVICNHVDCVKLLVRAGADPNRVATRAWSPWEQLLYKRRSTRIGTFHYGFNIYEGTSLAIAAAVGNSSCVQRLLFAGVSVNKMDSLGRTALMKALSCRKQQCTSHRSLCEQHDHDGCIRMLLDSGANVNRVDRRGQSALTMCIDLEHSNRTVHTLLQAGADVNLADPLGITPLYEAVWRGNVRYVKLLLDSGAQINRSTVFDPQQGVKHAVGGDSINFFCKIMGTKHRAILMLLIAAGEGLDSALAETKHFHCLKQYMGSQSEQQEQNDPPSLNLADICRKAIRKHLLEMDPHTHLFARIPRLPLPASLARYLLFNQNLAYAAED